DTSLLLIIFHSEQKANESKLPACSRSLFVHLVTNYGCKNTYKGASTRVIVLSSLISTWSDGPAVSLKGSPTVSPTTLALCGSLFLPSTVPLGSRRSSISPAAFTRR